MTVAQVNELVYRTGSVLISPKYQLKQLELEAACDIQDYTLQYLIDGYIPEFHKQLRDSN